MGDVKIAEDKYTNKMQFAHIDTANAANVTSTSAAFAGKQVVITPVSADASIQIIKDTVTVSGAGTSAVNGVYEVYYGSFNNLTKYSGSIAYKKGVYILYRASGGTTWQIDTDDSEDNDYYSVTSATEAPPTSGWSSDNEGDDPAPTLSLSSSSSVGKLIKLGTSYTTIIRLGEKITTDASINVCPLGEV